MLKKNNLVETNNDINLEVINSLNHCSQSIERLSVMVLSKYNLTVSQYHVLEILATEGPLKIREIIERVLSTGGNMTVIIKNLEKNFLVNRTTDKEDRRAILIGLSKKGDALIKKVLPKYQEFVGSYLNAVSEKDKQVFLKISHTIRSSIQDPKFQESQK